MLGDMFLWLVANLKQGVIYFIKQALPPNISAGSLRKYFLGSQLWKLENNILHNKGKIWESDEKWAFKRQTIDLIYIENISTKKVLGSTNHLVSQEDYVKGKGQQLWKKGEPNAEGYYTLETSSGTNIMTAVTSKVLVIKGNITLKKSYQLLTFYNVFFTYRS